MRKYFLLTLLLLFVFTFSFAQKENNIFHADTTKEGHKIKNSYLAMGLSAVVPGSGQIYNGKFWKIPIFYSGFYASYYFTKKYNIKYQMYSNDILLVSDTTFHGITQSGEYNLSTLQGDYDVARRNRDLYFLAGGLVWILNIIDAYIDAELSNFDVSDDLSMRIYPSMNYYSSNNYNVMLNVQFYLK